MGLFELLFGLVGVSVQEGKRYKERKRVMNERNELLEKTGDDYYYDIDGNRRDKDYNCKFYHDAPGRWVKKNGYMTTQRVPVYRYASNGQIIRDMTQEGIDKVMAMARAEGKETGKRFIRLNGSRVWNLMEETDRFDVKFKSYYTFDKSRYLDMKTGKICVLDFKAYGIYRDIENGETLGKYGDDI